MNKRTQVKVLGVYMHKPAEDLPDQHFVLLRDGRNRRLPIWTGQYEAWAISFVLSGERPERPMTHNLTLDLIAASGMTLIEGAITDLRDETFHAALTVRTRGGAQHIMDARPSDAIALALGAGCPIFVAEHIMAETARFESRDDELEE